MKREDRPRSGDRRSPPPSFFLLPLAQRIVGLDVVRGGAILVMTAYHQSLVVPPSGALRPFTDFLGFAAAPLFLVVSGTAAALHERRHHRPSGMVIRGVLLFLMAYAIDLAVQRTARVDWDVFQIIGACYAALGLAGYLGRASLRAAVATAALLVLVLRPEFRPDDGFFPPWPFAFYFAGGYFTAQFGLSPWTGRWSIRGLAAAALGCLLLVFPWSPLPDRTRPEGFLFLLALTVLALLAALELEERGRIVAGGGGALALWGKYPLTLYFAQQAVTVAGLRLPLPLPPAAAWMTQATVLLALMYAAARLMQRFAFLDVGWWLRQAERRVSRLLSP